MMDEWFQALSLVQQTLVVIAVFTGVIVVMQFLSTIFGLSTDADFDGEVDGTSFEFGDVFTIRNGITFLFGFSLGGLMAYEWGLTHLILVSLVGFLVGSGFVSVNLLILIAMSRLKDSGNINLENAIDERGRVTLTVPANRGGVGKVSVTVQGRLKEYHALTDGEQISKNSTVIVLEVLGSQLIVGPAP